MIQHYGFWGFTNVSESLLINAMFSDVTFIIDSLDEKQLAIVTTSPNLEWQEGRYDFADFVDNAMTCLSYAFGNSEDFSVHGIDDSYVHEFRIVPADSAEAASLMQEALQEAEERLEERIREQGS